MEVKSTKGDSTRKEGQVVKVVIFIESIGTIDEFSIAVLSLEHLVDKIEGRNAGEHEQKRE